MRALGLGRPTPSRLGESVRPLATDTMCLISHSLSLQLKGIPFKTEWVEYPDIEPLCKRIGALPTSKKTDGRDHYTLPTIFDPSTGRAISDSLPIALYLDQTYPDSPGHSLFPNKGRWGLGREGVGDVGLPARRRNGIVNRR